MKRTGGNDNFFLESNNLSGARVLKFLTVTRGEASVVCSDGRRFQPSGVKSKFVREPSNHCGRDKDLDGLSEPSWLTWQQEPTKA